MLRALIYLIVSIVAITFIRGVIGIIMRGMGEALKEESQPPPRQTTASATPTQGELKPCAQCGTYVLTSRAISDGGRNYCSEDCRKKATAA